MLYPFDQRFLDIPEYTTSSEVCVTNVQRQKLEKLITFIWPEHDSPKIQAQFDEIIAEAQKRISVEQNTEITGWSEQQLVLICYGDHLRSRHPNRTPLQVLGEFCQEYFHEQEFSQLDAASPPDL